MGTLRGLVVFGSSTGATRVLASAVKSGLRSAGIDAELRNAARVHPDQLAGFPVLVAGCSTWEDGAPQRDFRRLLSELGDLRLDGVAAAVFGPGSSSYPLFCHAVDLLEHELEDRGARLLLPSLRVDGSPYPARSRVRLWAQALGGLLRRETGSP